MTPVRILCLNPWAASTEARERRRDQLPPGLLAADTTVDFASTADFPAGRIETHYEAALLDMLMVEAGLRAEESGYDAVVFDSASDPGLAALRSRLRIPVVGAGLASYVLAAALGQRFGIVTYIEEHRLFYERALKAYDLGAKCAGIRAAGISPDHERLLEDDEEAKLALIGRAAQRVIFEDRADVIVLGSVTMHDAAKTLSSTLDVPIINPGPVALKLAETIVTLGLSHSERAYRPPQVLQDAVWHRLTPTCPHDTGGAPEPLGPLHSNTRDQGHKSP